MKHKASPAVGQTSRAAKKIARAERRAARDAVVSIHKRPLVCPPDRAGRHPLFRLFGIFARAMVIWLSSAGLVIFLCDAVQAGVSSSAILLTALITVSLGMVFAYSTAGKIAVPIAALGGMGAMVAVRPRLVSDLPYSFLSLYNAILDRLNRLGYWTYAKFRVDITDFTDTSDDLLTLEAVCIITLLVSLLFVSCLSRKVVLIPPAILSTTLIAVILTFNIYTNSISSNAGIVLVIVSFASILVMATYDRLYRRPDSRQYDTELQLFDDSDRPTMPAGYTEGRARATRARMGRRKVVTIDEDITGYFERGKKKKRGTSALSPAERQAAKETRRAVRAVKHYDRVTEHANFAMGGFAAAAVLLVCLLAIGLPALTIQGNFSTIPSIDEKVEFARDYVTALLRGDDKALDRLDYQADGTHFTPRSTDAEQLEYTGKQIFYVQSRYNTNLYLRGWVGLDYKDGAWCAVDSETLNTYHETFGENGDPAEEMKYDFYRYIKPDLVMSTQAHPERIYPDYYMSHFGANTGYGFVGTLVSLRRVNSPDSLTYFPTSFDPNYGLFAFDSVTPLDLSYVNYYDGIYTGRAFDQNKLEYATVAYAPVMTDPFWSERLSHLQVSYSLQREALLARSAMAAGGDRFSLSVTETEEGLIQFRYTLKASRRTDPDTVWTTCHSADTYIRSTGPKGEKIYTVTTADGTLVLTLDGKTVMGVTVTSVTGEDLLAAYDGGMTDTERADLLFAMERDRDYTAFVYDTYTARSGSASIRELAFTIRDAAHRETYEDGRYTDVPTDVSLAAVRNPSVSDAYVQRDLLVRNVIDYLITEMGCTYTITPDTSAADPARDGVENFLFNTKEGYCVQFASSVALLLRELGIPTRYVEGYVASDLSKRSGDFSYGGYVRDSNAHAWVEVWFDGVGWVSYETTPTYYASLYGVTSAIDTGMHTGGNQDPSLSETEEETLPESESMTESETTAETEEDTETDPVPVVPSVKVDPRPYLIGAGVLILLAGILLLCRRLATRASLAEQTRRDTVRHALDPDAISTDTPEQKRQVAADITDAVMELLTLLGLSPLPGEFREDYAERLTAALLAPTTERHKKKRGRAAAAAAEREAALSALPRVRVALEGMAAQEFGHGMSDRELSEVAALYLFLHGQIKRRIPLMRRVRLHYGKRKI